MATEAVLAGDLGGTKTNLAILALGGDAHRPLAEGTLSSADFPSLEALVARFLEDRGGDFAIARASFGVAGPVVKGKATITNLPWRLDELRLRGALKIPSVHLLNDLEAVANSVPLLQAGDVETLNEGPGSPHGAIAVIAPGTGLGEGYLTWDGRRYRGHASEGGHVDFAPTTPRQRGLLQYLALRYDHVSYERVCSGLGIPNIYDYLRDSGEEREPEWLAARLSARHDRTPAIVAAALDKETPCPIAAATLDMFVSILAAQAGNLALTLLATGGVYLGGGIPPRILPRLHQEDFMSAFVSKGRFKDLLSNVPVHVIVNAKSALLGAAHHVLG